MRRTRRVCRLPRARRLASRAERIPAASAARKGTNLAKAVKRTVERERDAKGVSLGKVCFWTSHGIVDTLAPHAEARSKASGLTPPR